MTNLNIITNDAVANGIFTKEQAEAILGKGYALPLHTFSGWKNRGYLVKKGEHAKMTSWIWKPKGGKKEETDEEIEENNPDFFKCKAFFFTLEQVEKA